MTQFIKKTYRNEMPIENSNMYTKIFTLKALR